MEIDSRGKVQRKRKKIENCKYCELMNQQKQCPVYGKQYCGCGKINHYKAVGKSAQKQEKSQKSPQRSKTVHET